jgi:hypothetical protein
MPAVTADPLATLNTLKLLKLVLSCPPAIPVVSRSAQQLLNKLMDASFRITRSLSKEGENTIRKIDGCLRLLFENLPFTRTQMFQTERDQPGFSDFLVEKALNLWPRDVTEKQDLLINHFAKYLTGSSSRSQALKMVRMARNNVDSLSSFPIHLFRTLVQFVLTNLETTDTSDPTEYQENIGLLKAIWKAESSTYKVSQVTEIILDRFTAFLPPQTPNCIIWLRILIE